MIRGFVSPMYAAEHVSQSRRAGSPGPHRDVRVNDGHEGNLWLDDRS